MAPHRYQVPISGTYKYHLIGKYGFEQIKLGILRWKDHPRLSRQALIAITMAYDRQRNIRQTEEKKIR